MNKKRLVGGEFLIDLAVMSFVMSVNSETFTDITNQEVINQLTDLKTYIRNPKSIKPVWVRLQDNDDYIVARGELSKDKDSNVFVIRVKFKGQLLTINVEFTQMLNEDNDPIDDYYIDSGDAGYNLVSQNNLSSIVDNQGNPRFIEGDISLSESIPEGVSKEYGKWSLSGTHLLIVLCLNLADTTTINDGQILAILDNLPDWIYEKISIIAGTTIEYKNFTAYASNGTTQGFNSRIVKVSDTISIRKEVNLTLTADRKVRLSYDILIDSEAPAEEIGD